MLYSAEEKNELHFKLLDRRSKSGVRYERVSEATGEPVPPGRVVKGYEYERWRPCHPYRCVLQEGGGRSDRDHREHPDFVNRTPSRYNILKTYPVNAAALAAGVAAVEERKSIARYIRDVKRLRAWFARELQKRNVRVYPSSANFLLADFGKTGPAFFRKLEATTFWFVNAAMTSAPALPASPSARNRNSKNFCACLGAILRKTICPELPPFAATPRKRKLSCA